MAKGNKRKKPTYKGTVLREFKIKGVVYRVGKPYETNIKGRFDYLINLKKIKR